jgi:hypothetical protein
MNNMMFLTGAMVNKKSIPNSQKEGSKDESSAARNQYFDYSKPRQA